MIIPIRCFTCNKVVGHMWNDYLKMVEEKKNGMELEGEKTAERFVNQRSIRRTRFEEILLQKNATGSC